MTTDADKAQDQRIQTLESKVTAIETRQGETETKVAVLDVRVEGFEKAMDTGMVRLETALKTAITDQTTAEGTKAEKDREESRWWWGKVFAIVVGAPTAIGGVFAAYYGLSDTAPVEASPIEHAAPVVQPVEESQP